MSFLSVRFPTDISYGSRGGPGFNTSIIRLDSGGEERVSRWGVPLHQYDVSYGIRSWADLTALKTFYWSVLGAGDGFLFKDWSDYATTPSGIADTRSNETVTKDDVVIGTGDGSEVDFQLYKFYENALVTRVRPITKPVEGTLLVAVDGTLQTEGADYTVDYTTGLVTFGTAPGSLLDVTAGFEFDVPVRFGEEADAALQSTWSSFGHGDVPSIQLEELVSGLVVPGQFFYGGAYDHGDSAVDVTMSLTQGFLHIVKPTAVSLKARLPRADDIPTGGIVLAVVNNGSQSIAVTDFDGVSTATTLAVSGVTELLLSLNSSLVKTWIAK